MSPVRNRLKLLVFVHSFAIITIIKGKKMVIGRRNGFNVVVMLDKDMAYALSSDLSSKRLLALFAELII